jgi:hypothetical protein
MDSVVSRVTPADVEQEPFPHVVVKDALDRDVCDRLIEEFPPLELFARGRSYGSNQRFNIHGNEAADDERLSPLWRELVRVHQSQAFLDQLLALFANGIRASYPSFEDVVGPLDKLRAGIRFRDSFDDADVLVEAQPALNTPVTGPATSVRAGHLDNPDKLFVGLYYLRHPDDTSSGGDLELYRYTTSRPAFDDHEVAARYIEPVAKVGYEANSAVLFLNTDRSLHGVTPRTETPVPRLFLNLNFEVKRDLFTIPDHRPSPLRVLGRRTRTLARRTVGSG